MRTPLLLATVAALSACAIPIPVPMAGPPGVVVGAADADPLPPSPRIPAEVDPTFCDAPGSSVASRVSGDWTFEGGERTAWMATAQGSMVMRVRPEDDEEFALRYMEDAGLLHATSPESDDEMYLFPATEEQLSAAGALLGGSSSGPGCDWHDSPLFIGTNYYYGNDGLHLVDAGQWLPSCTARAMSGAALDPSQCHVRPAPEDEDFHMEMTIVVRFANANYASGMLYFEGELEDDDLGQEAAQTLSEFRARATVEFFRR